MSIERRATASELFAPLGHCWVCGGGEFRTVHEGIFDLSEYREQDPELSEYTNLRFRLNRCVECGFAQPDVIPTLPLYFDRMYDQHWSEEWLEGEFDATYKDVIFSSILDRLDRLVPAPDRSLLDIGAHVGRFVYLAASRGWESEGVELNPRTAAIAARRTNRPVHQANADTLADGAKRYHAVTMTDVLEHIPDPVKMLRTAAALLVSDGWIAVKVPCGPNQLFKEAVRARLKRGYRISVADNLVHINHFSPQSLQLALESAGFGNVSMTLGAPELHSSPTVTTRTLGANALRLGMYYLGRALPGGVRTPLALNLQAYAQKVATCRG